MKLAASILVASAAGQEFDGSKAKLRENKTPNAGGFGGFDYSNFDFDAFGAMVAATQAPDEAFDLSGFNLGAIYDQYNDALSAAGLADSSVAASAGRPSSSDAEAGKTNFLQSVTVTDPDYTATYASHCWVSSSAIGNPTVVIDNWFANGAWDSCPSENETCEIKIVRRGEKITQIHSKCANRFSCIDNMHQNFPPRTTATSTIYSQWKYQQCRPIIDSDLSASGPFQNLSGYNGYNRRTSGRDSTCFFCIEPCRYLDIINNVNTVTLADMQLQQCVGKANNHKNAHPIKANDNVFLFTDDKNAATYSTSDRDLGQGVGGFAPQAVTSLDAMTNNFYSTTEVQLLHPTNGAMRETVSYLQLEQIRAAADFTVSGTTVTG